MATQCRTKPAESYPNLQGLELGRITTTPQGVARPPFNPRRLVYHQPGTEQTPAPDGLSSSIKKNTLSTDLSVGRDMGESSGTLRLKKRATHLELDMSPTSSLVGAHLANYSNSTTDILALMLTSLMRTPKLT
jgi:hypothetical protein